MITFLIQSGKHAGKILNLTGNQILVGRDDACQIRLSTADISRRHCLMTLSDSRWVIRDLNSQNGTFVNDAELNEEQVLQPGDRIRIGPMVLEFSPTNAASQATPSVDTIAKSKTTDVDIANWLTEDDRNGDGSGDTTIIPSPRKSAKDSAPADTASAVEVPAVPSPRGKKSFHSVAEEAAEIIRHHWETVNREEADSDATP